MRGTSTLEAIIDELTTEHQSLMSTVNGILTGSAISTPVAISVLLFTAERSVTEHLPSSILLGLSAGIGFYIVWRVCSTGSASRSLLMTKDSDIRFKDIIIDIKNTIATILDETMKTLVCTMRAWLIQTSLLGSGIALTIGMVRT